MDALADNPDVPERATMQYQEKYVTRTIKKTVTIIEVWDLNGNRLAYADKGKVVKSAQLGEVTVTTTEQFRFMTKAEVALTAGLVPPPLSDWDVS